MNNGLCRLLERFGKDVICEKVGEGKTLLQQSIVDQQFERARQLFDYAEEKKLIIDLDWNGDDMLGYSLKTLYSREAVQLVLEKMLNRCADAKKTAILISKHLRDLVTFFPDVFEKLVEEDGFCFEYGRFKVPKSIFEEMTEKPIGMISDQQLSWREASEQETEEFWLENCPNLNTKIENAKEEEQITAVSKYSCIEDAVFVKKTGRLADLVPAKCSVDVFACEAIRTNVQWKWQNYLKHRFVFSNLMYLTSVAFFVIFTAYYGDIAHVHEEAAEGHHWELVLARISICCSFGFLIFPLLAKPSSFIW